MQFHREKTNTKKPQEFAGKFIEKHMKRHETKIPSTSYERRQELFLHDRKATPPVETVACSSDIKNINHKQLATNTGHAAIRYSNPGISIAFLIQQKPASSFKQLRNRCMSF